jgi:anti-sigma factor RsiW
MGSNVDKSQPSDEDLAVVSHLADGTIDPARRADAERRVAQSPELSALYERERRVVDLLHQAGSTDRAPASLRARIDAQRPTAKSRLRRRPTYIGALAGAVAAVALALALILPGGTPASPSVAQAAGLAVLGPAQIAPGPNPRSPASKLNKDVEEVYFPNWERLGWRADGQRADKLNGRATATVYYGSDGHQVAYTIVGAPALREPPATVTRLDDTVLWTTRMNGRVVVTWRRDGRTCVLSATGVSPRVLQGLAAWPVPA